MSSLEVRVDQEVHNLLKDHPNLHQQNDIPNNLKEALTGASKAGSGQGRPDFSLTYKTRPNLAVVIENKWGLDRLEDITPKGKHTATKKAITQFAVNGAMHYADQILKSEKFTEVIAIGIAGEMLNNNLTLALKAYYFYKEGMEPKEINLTAQTISRLLPEEFEDFYHEISLTREEKDAVLAKNYDNLQKASKALNRMFYDYAVAVEHRVVIVSGMLLAMENGLEPENLKGDPSTSSTADGALIYTNLSTLLDKKHMPNEKKAMMQSVFGAINADPHRNEVRDGIIQTGKGASRKSSGMSINKEIFTFIYDNVFKEIRKSGHLDSLGEMYSSFLKYALGDGKENGIVLTPPYTTKLMANLIDINMQSRVLDPCTGSAGFLVTAMNLMLTDAQDKLSGDDLKLQEKSIKSKQLLGVENDVKMFTLAATNMILRGDGSSNIVKASFFDKTSDGTVTKFNPDKALLNPPFSWSENGMPFALDALDNMQTGGKLAIIIQDSAGTGKATKTNKQILTKHTLLASIKMPADLFQPSAGVQTSIYVIEAGTPHDFKKKVRFIDLSDDGYKRTGRGLRTIDNPDQRYIDILDVYHYGDSADNTSDIPWIDDVITNSGNDWNFTQHQIFDTEATEQDFMDTVGAHMAFELSMILAGHGELIGFNQEGENN